MGINLILFGDSLSLPRPFEKEQANNYSEVWTGIINKFEGINSVINLAKPAVTSSEILILAKSYYYYTDHQDNLIIIYTGVVDSSPRPYPKLLQRPFNLVSILLSKIFGISWRHKTSPFLLKIWGKPWISPKRFAQNIRSTCELFRNSNILIIGLMKPGENLIRKLGEFDVDSYNLALRRLTSTKVHYIELEAQQSLDGHHLSKTGQTEIATKVYECIRSIYSLS